MRKEEEEEEEKEEEEELINSSFPFSFLLSSSSSTANELIKEAIDEYDDKLINFTHFFEQSHAGRLLADVVYDLSIYPSSPVYTTPIHPIIVPLEGYPTASPQQGSVLLTTFISLVCFSAVIPFSYLGAYGNLQEYSIKSLAALVGYFVCSFSLSIINGVAPELLQCLLSLIAGGAAGYFAFYISPKMLNFAAKFISCLLASNLLFALWAGIPYADISPAFSGPAGLIFNTGFVGNIFYFLRVIYYLFLFFIGGLFYLSLPPYAKDKEPITTQERIKAQEWENRLMGFSFGWIVAGVISQIIYLFGAPSSPLDPLSFFFVPCQFQWNRWESYVSLLVWALISFFFSRLRAQNETDIQLDVNMLPPAVLERWKLMGSQ